jgi:hypothetical protein
MQFGTVKIQSQKLCPNCTDSVWPILSVLCLDRISNLRVFNRSNEFNSHSTLDPR